MAQIVLKKENVQRQLTNIINGYISDWDSVPTFILDQKDGQFFPI